MNFIIKILSFGISELVFSAHPKPTHFQSPSTLTFDKVIDFHDFIMIYLFVIFILFAWSLIWSINIYKYRQLVIMAVILSHFVEIFVYYLYDCIRYSKFLHSNRLNFRMSSVILVVFIKELYTYLFSTRIHPFKHPIILDFEGNIMILHKIAVFLSNNLLLITRRATHAPTLEIAWTILPSFILLAIAIPSLYLLYMLDAIDPLSFAVKVVAHQWYWSYEIGFYSPLYKFNLPTTTSFDSYMIPDSQATLRLLEVDNVLFVPAGLPITFLVTSTDVIHSWAIPDLGIKVDAIPGRLNQVCVTITDIGCHVGQCSELCGVNHGFMPINIYSYVDSTLPACLR
jgi:cytochrome c oxidase subunit 2